MLIQTLNRRYSVILVLNTSNDADVCVCRDIWEDSGREYLLVAVKNPDLICRCAPFYTRQAGNRSFTDFIECFSRDGQFYIVFAYYAKPTLKAKLTDELYFLSERLDIGKNLLSQILLQNMPPNILYEALQDRNLLLDDALQVHFNYVLEEVASFALFSFDRVQMELARVFRFLLRQEIAGQSSDEIRSFVDDLEACAFTDYMSVYEAYDRIYDMLKALVENGEINPRSFLFRCWERIKRLARLMRPVLVGVVLVTALVFLVYSIANPAPKPGSPPPSIEAIGTVRAR
jgi:hypothetical protein